jgi:hypothetical protein
MYLRALVGIISLAFVGFAMAAETSMFDGRMAFGFEGALFNPEGQSELWRVDGTPDLLVNLWADKEVGKMQCVSIVFNGRPTDRTGKKKLYIESIISITPLTDCEFADGYEVPTPSDSSDSATFVIEKYREGARVFVALRHEYYRPLPETNYSSSMYDCEDGTYRLISAARTAEEMRRKPADEHTFRLFKEGTVGGDLGRAACQ